MKSAGEELARLVAERGTLEVVEREWLAAGSRSGGPPEVEVKRYKNDKDYERDARRMLAAGWRMEGQSSHQGKVSMGRTVLKAGVFLPWAMMRPSRKGDPISVTWLRGRGLEEVDVAPAVNASPGVPTEDVPGKLRDLAQLRDEGVLTPEEFESKKAELLGRL
jgi:hypothetical protein